MARPARRIPSPKPNELPFWVQKGHSKAVIERNRWTTVADALVDERRSAERFVD
jgi:hypothetical protein